MPITNQRASAAAIISALIVLACLTTRASAAEAKIQSKAALDLLVLEAEDCTDAGGAPIGGVAGTRSDLVFINTDPHAGGGAYITPVPKPYRIHKPFPKPIEASGILTIPVAGHWYGFVRYVVTPPAFRKTSKTVHYFHVYGAFDVSIGGKNFTVGTNQEEGEEFRWDTFEVDLAAGRTNVKFLMPDMAAIDCLVLTQRADYSPDIHDYEGPLWLRFKVVKGVLNPHYIGCTCHFNSYERKLPRLAGLLFKDVVATSQVEADRLARDEDHLLAADEWTPWVQVFQAKKKHIFAEVTVIPVPDIRKGAAKKDNLDAIEMAYQASTRADEAYLVHEGIESPGHERSVSILLPSGEGQAARGVRGFSEWADDRLDLVKRLGVSAGEGPRRIRVLAMDASVRTPRDAENFLETCRLMGFNGCDINTKVVDPEQLWDRITKSGLTFTTTHHLSPAYSLERWLDLPAAPPAGQSMQQIVDHFWYGVSMERIHGLWDDRPAAQRQMVHLANMVDEPGSVPHFIIANCIPAMKLCFHDFLRANNLTPEFFGKKSWDEVNVIGYTSKNEGIGKYLAEVNIEAKFFEPSAAAAFTAAAQYEKTPGKDAAPAHYLAHVPVTKGLRVAGPEEKRQYYWSQRFRSFFTHHFYGQTAKAVEDLAKQGYFPADVTESPNFQADVMMETRMWDGGLDLFEWARAGATNFLMMEDWINDPVRVSFGLALLDSASQKRGQSLGYLIVADRHYRQRYLTGLAMGAKLFFDYLYGPINGIGPAWGDDAREVRDRAEMLRWTRRAENDLLASHRWKADTAILVANSSEINMAFYNACSAETGLKFKAAAGRPLFRRAGIYSILLDAGVPADIISETQILEDQSLDRYKVLYVTDTHVSTKVQQAISAWVKNGGTLWADYTALARNEFDEDSSAMNDAFGLTQRGVIPNPVMAAQKDAKGETIKINAGDGLQAVTFEGSLFHPAWKLSTAKTLATFSDSSPALILNQFGKGRAILLGCSVLMLSDMASQSDENPDFAKARHAAIFAAELAGAARPFQVNVPRVNTYVRDGPNQAVMVLINSTEKDQAAIGVRLTVSHKALSAFDGRGKPVQFQQNGDEITFERSIAADDGDIVIFKW